MHRARVDAFGKDFGGCILRVELDLLRSRSSWSSPCQGNQRCAQRTSVHCFFVFSMSILSSSHRFTHRFTHRVSALGAAAVRGELFGAWQPGNASATGTTSVVGAKHQCYRCCDSSNSFNSSIISSFQFISSIVPSVCLQSLVIVCMMPMCYFNNWKHPELMTCFTHNQKRFPTLGLARILPRCRDAMLWKAMLP